MTDKTNLNVPIETVKELCNRAFGAGSTFALVKVRSLTNATDVETFALWWEHTLMMLGSDDDRLDGS